VANPLHNAQTIAELAGQAEGEGAAVVAFPELALTGYTCEDLFHQQALLAETDRALRWLIAQTKGLATVLVVGTPLATSEGLFNVAVAIKGGKALAAFPKSYLPNYMEYYERRHFRPARESRLRRLQIGGEEVPFSAQLLLRCSGPPPFALHVELCEDLWVPLPPSTLAALAGATVLVNISASNAAIAKADYRRLLARSQSGRCVAALLYVSAGEGESTTDLAFDGHALVCENGELIGEQRWEQGDAMLVCDVDLERLAADRLRLNGFAETAADHRRLLDSFEEVTVGGPSAAASRPLRRPLSRYPFVPADRRRLDERCAEVFAIQVRGLASRLRATSLKRLVIGVSGGLDSTHALLVCVKAVEELGLPRQNVLAYTLPGFGTTPHTLATARALIEALGVGGGEIDIRPASEALLAAIGHPAAQGQPHYDTTYENVQAGERASHLFRLANLHQGLVVGTSDLSELALGWCTYGVGDQMSHYAVNSSVPKTLIQFLIAWSADRQSWGKEVSDLLTTVLETEISPELVPARSDRPAADSEQVVGPYDLVDFFLYYTLRFGYRPSKVAFLAEQAWSDPNAGSWPALIPRHRRRAFSRAEIKGWLEVFLRRFFAFSQFKRSALPNGPKVGSGGSLSPRGDWRAPSDSGAEPWLRELEENFPV